MFAVFCVNYSMNAVEKDVTAQQLLVCVAYLQHINIWFFMVNKYTETNTKVAAFIVANCHCDVEVWNISCFVVLYYLQQFI